MSDNLNEYKCPCCGGAITFDSSIQKMKCPYCNSEFEMETLKKYDEELKNKKPDKLDWSVESNSTWSENETENMKVYVCKSCGGEIIGDKTTASTKCPFCDNPVVIMGNFAGDLRPDYIIPFKLDKKAAKEGLSKHLKGKFLLPKIFKDENHIDEIKGIYVPFWLFKGQADANIRYRATRIHTWADDNYIYTQTNYYSVLREGNLKFSNLPVDGSSKMDDELMESIEPFSFSDSVDFQTAYLAGYMSDRYDVTAEKSIDRANERVKRTTEDSFASTVKGFSTVVPESTSIRLTNGEAKYALYPVWLLNTSWQGKKYTFAMNGQTGKFVGDLPMDKAKYWGLVGAASGIGSIIIYLLILLINLL
ncbi:MAG: hypothetical protein Q4B93_02855 [Clostridia bacterium]|nr:hypothetical protein [Clostridia bacterium]